MIPQSCRIRLQLSHTRTQTLAVCKTTAGVCVGRGPSEGAGESGSEPVEFSIYD